MFASLVNNDRLRQPIVRRRQMFSVAEHSTNRRGERTNCSGHKTLPALGCDTFGLQEFQLKIGQLSRALQLRTKSGANTNTGGTRPMNSLLAMATMGSGKTLAAWCIAMNFATYLHLAPSEVLTVIFLADDEQTKNFAREAQKFMKLLSKQKPSSALSPEAKNAFLKALPNPKCILLPGKTATPLQGRSAGSAAQKVISRDAGTLPDARFDEVFEYPFAAADGNAQQDKAYETIMKLTKLFYNEVVKGPLLTYMKQNSRFSDALAKLKPQMEKFNSGLSTTMFNMSAYIQTLYDIGRPMESQKRLYKNDDGLYGVLHRMDPNSLMAGGKVQLRVGDLVRFYMRAEYGDYGKVASPYYMVTYVNSTAPVSINYMKGRNGTNQIGQLKLTSLLQGADGLADLFALLGWEKFTAVFRVDTSNILRFERVPTPMVRIVDTAIINSRWDQEQKYFDLAPRCVRSIGSKYGDPDKVQLDTRCKKNGWWMRHGSWAPTWWPANPYEKGAKEKRTWPKRPERGGKMYQTKFSRGTASLLPQTLLLGMTHESFRELVDNSGRTGWNSTLIICDEVHQDEKTYGAAEKALAQCVQHGAKVVGLTATPYDDPRKDLHRVLSKLAGEPRVINTPPARWQAGDVQRYASRGNILMYVHDTTTGKHNNIMPTMYPEVAGKVGQLNLRQTLVNYRGGGADNSLLANRRSATGDIVNPSVLTTKYPFRAVKRYPVNYMTGGAASRRSRSTPAKRATRGKSAASSKSAASAVTYMTSGSKSAASANRVGASAGGDAQRNEAMKNVMKQTGLKKENMGKVMKIYNKADLNNNGTATSLFKKMLKKGEEIAKEKAKNEEENLLDEAQRAKDLSYAKKYLAKKKKAKK